MEKIFRETQGKGSFSGAHFRRMAQRNMAHTFSGGKLEAGEGGMNMWWAGWLDEINYGI